MKPISPKVHGILDYVTVALFALAPTVFGLDGLPAKISLTLAGVHLLMTVFTAMPLGVVKAIPFKVHGAVELGVGLTLIALPWMLGFAQVDTARNFYLAIGIVILIVVMLTDYRNATDGSATRA